MPILQFLPHADQTIAYRMRKGRDPGVVFLPGLMSDMDGTKANFLDEHCHRTGCGCLRFDYSGHGQSSGTFAERTIRHWIDETWQILSTLAGGRPPILVGSSMGAWIALHIAREHPDRVAGLVLIAAAPDFTTTLIESLTTEQAEALTTEGVFTLPSDSGADAIPITRHLLDDGAVACVLDRPLALPMPVRLLHGDRDGDVPLAHVLELFAHLDCNDLTLTLLKGEGHRMSSPRCLQVLRDTVTALTDGQDPNP